MYLSVFWKRLDACAYGTTTPKSAKVQMGWFAAMPLQSKANSMQIACKSKTGSQTMANDVHLPTNTQLQQLRRHGHPQLLFVTGIVQTGLVQTP
jgi:hypothetical protein